MFPILGGRLLKSFRIGFFLRLANVSNPWREAIEDESTDSIEDSPNVSNPWREAIEGTGRTGTGRAGTFPILGGRLLKTFYKTIKSSGGLFPILGGRLLKSCACYGAKDLY